ncbi:hypothetical protein CANINC_003335 [Pichia inconspicua]|uniref:ABC transporter domain-containing protein n=1 Tax=Pichia inconspicua TaxID=52247 RepID=A0A4T0X080_9ASCO|nr:hypothetical protein CANINC_003335 [[Candida] inconspicua]
MHSLVSIYEAWFLRASGTALKAVNPRPVFSSPISCKVYPRKTLAVIGDAYKTDFLSVLANRYIARPINSRTFPASLTNPKFKTELLKFVNNGSWGHGASNSSGGFTHLSSRYEFFKDLEVDEYLKDFVANKSYNSNIVYDEKKIERLLISLDLKQLENNFITTLSNGQFRRARIARELYNEPTLLCIDDPFLGLDPKTAQLVDNVLQDVSNHDEIQTTLVLGFRSQDDIPKWISDVIIVGDSGIIKQGKRDELLYDLQKLKDNFMRKHKSLEGKIQHNLESQYYLLQEEHHSTYEKIIEMNKTNIKYKGVTVIKDLNWIVKEGEKWHIRGRNGSGKTTLLSLITLDHPQSWNKSIKVFGVARSPGKVNYFDTNKYIGMTSPELHAIYPKHHTTIQTISTGYLVGSFVPPKDLTQRQSEKIEKFLSMLEINHLKDTKFGELDISKQKLVLLLRALINNPKILILDEALSAMNDEDLIKGKLLIDHIDTTCLIIGHVAEELPKCEKFLQIVNAPEGEYEIGDV